jgi:cytochrome c553
VSAAGFPRLAGQATEYLRRQLESYANDTRRNAVMQPIAKALSAEQRLAAATYYSRIEPPPESASASASAPRGPAATAGRRLAAVGDAQAGVQACANCHGPEGIGEGAYPFLAGQHGSYLVAALTEWKDGSRDNDPSGQMQRIAKALGQDQIQTVAAYFASLPAPSPAAKESGAKRPALATVVSGPRVRGEGGQTPALGVGSEQGAPLSGGTQGVGGPGNPNGPSGAATQGPASAPR